MSSSEVICCEDMIHIYSLKTYLHMEAQYVWTLLSSVFIRGDRCEDMIHIYNLKPYLHMEAQYLRHFPTTSNFSNDIFGTRRKH